MAQSKKIYHGTQEQLADMMREMGMRAVRAADLTTGIQRKLKMREGMIWREASEMVRDTQITPPEPKPLGPDENIGSIPA